MGLLRSAVLLLTIILAGGCQILPAELTRDLVPAQPVTSYKVAESAYEQLLDRHVDRPDSKLLINGALDGVEALLKAQSITPAYDRPVLTGDRQGDLRALAATLDLLAQKYPQHDPAADKAGLDRARHLERVATDGMARAMNECHTYYLSPDRAKTFNKPPEAYSGIGAQIAATRPGEMPQIAAIFPNTPASRSGLKSGDRIKTVNGEDVSALTAQEVATRIRGDEGTTVTIVVQRGTQDLTFSIVRATLVPPRVVAETLDGSIGYVRVMAFNGDVTRQTSEAVNGLLAAGVRGLVLDLRDNPGGDLSAAQDIGSIFTKGTLVKQVGRDGQPRDLGTNDRWFWKTPKPLVVLVNERSASGSEIVAAGVRANGAGAVVGTTTAGCVGIGSPRELPDGSMLLITIARMQDAKTGAELNGEGRGVKPDVTTGTEPDAQLQAAIAALRERF